MKKKWLILLALICLLLVGCSNKTTDKKKEVYRDWQEVEISFQNDKIQLNAETTGFENIKKLESLDMLTKLDYDDGFENCYGDPVLEIDLVENDMLYSYIIYTDRIVFIDNYSIYDKCAKISKAELNLILDELMPVIGDNYFYSGCEIGEKYKEQSEHLDSYDALISTNRFEEHYRITNDPNGQRIYHQYFDNDNFGYMEMQYRLNAADLPDVSHYYEAEYNGMFAYENNDFYGEKTRVDKEDLPELEPFKDEIFVNMMYESSRKLTYKDTEIIREHYNGGSSKKCVAYFEDAGMNGVLYEDGRISIISCYAIDERGAFDGDFSSGFIAEPQINDTYEESSVDEDAGSDNNIENNSGNNDASSGWDDELIQSYDYYTEFNENNLFDFEAERVKGENIENPGIVENYRSLFVTGNDYTVYITSMRADGYLSCQYTTQAGENYFMERVSQVPGEWTIIGNDVCVGGRKYYKSYYAGEDEEYTLDPYGDEYGAFVELIIQGGDIFDDEFVEAYYVYINDEEYICEVWHTGVTNYFVYCKDGKVIVMEDDHEPNFTRYVVEYVYTYAETEKIVEPEEYIERQE